LIVDAATRLPRRDFVSLAGTAANCAGGRTPWRSWITCEETFDGPNVGFVKKHGYCFEVPVDATSIADAVPLTSLGRFIHEAVAVDPATSIVYLTEDTATAGFYRFVPSKRGVLAAGGRLQMLAVLGTPRFDTTRGRKRGDRFAVQWVDILDPDPASFAARPDAVFNQGYIRGGALFRRLEGAIWSGRSIIFSSTTGGDAAAGQLWEYIPPRRRTTNVHSETGGELRMLYESTSRAELNMPDNLTVRGSNVLICEDNGSPEHFLRFLTPAGSIINFARNIVPGFENTELTGATFTDDGSTLFVNIQRPGLTLAIWGAW
jgi:secreted PhoX family phosphatase